MIKSIPYTIDMYGFYRWFVSTQFAHFDHVLAYYEWHSLASLYGDE